MFFIGEWKWIAAGVIAGVFSLGAAFAEEKSAPEWDAKYVKMDVPKKLVTDQVFLAKVTMKNTGTAVWREARDVVPSSLHSQEPDDNLTWGTSYFIQGQGTTVAPGQEFTYVSNLKAPGKPGKYVFRWRLSGKKGLFGESTAAETIVVEKRKEPEEKPVPLPKPDEKGRRGLTLDDFEYAGSFRIASCGTWTESGLALRKMKDGTKRLFVNSKGLREVEIPELVKYDGTNFAALKVAEDKKVWGPMTAKDVGANGGFFWNEDKKILYWTYYHGYWTGGALQVLNATRLDDDGKVTSVGSWTVPNQKWHWGGVAGLPKDFAAKYTGGRRLALGFGGYYSVCGPCSRGPALGAIAEPDPSKPEVDLLPLLGYKDPAKAPRDGNYFSANCGFWNDPPDGPTKGYWSFDDWCRAGVFISLPDKQGYVAFVKLGTGRFGYDYGGINSAGVAQYWYFYDTRDLGQVAQGKKKSEMPPYLMAKITYPGNQGGCLSAICGACFDEETRMVYVYKPFAAILSNEDQPPLVHVYRVKQR